MATMQQASDAMAPPAAPKAPRQKLEPLQATISVPFSFWKQEFRCVLHPPSPAQTVQPGWCCLCARGMRRHARARAPMHPHPRLPPTVPVHPARRSLVLPCHLNCKVVANGKLRREVLKVVISSVSRVCACTVCGPARTQPCEMSVARPHCVLVVASTQPLRALLAACRPQLEPSPTCVACRVRTCTACTPALHAPGPQALKVSGIHMLAAAHQGFKILKWSKVDNWTLCLHIVVRARAPCTQAACHSMRGGSAWQPATASWLRACPLSLPFCGWAHAGPQDAQAHAAAGAVLWGYRHVH